MDAAEKAIFEMREWALKTLREEPVRGDGKAALNRGLIARLDTCHDLGAAPPQELTALVARQLNVDGNIRNQPRLKTKQMVAAAALARDRQASSKNLAKLCDVSVPTITRWKTNPQFNKLREIFELDQVLREFFPWQQGSPASPFL